MISQLSVFLENTEGRLHALIQKLADEQINLRALFLADTADFGVVRMFCDTPKRACDLLKEAGYRAILTDVCALHIKDEAGGLLHLLDVVHDEGLNIEYAYCMPQKEGRAIDVLKFSTADAEVRLRERGVDIVEASEVYALDK